MRRKLRFLVLSRVCSALLLFGCLWLFPKTVLSQPSSVPAGNPPKKYKLEGSVINSLTGEPVPRALVQLNGQTQESVLTGSDGRFHFDAVPEGQVVVNVRKPGFFEKEQGRLSSWVRSTVIVGPQTGPLTRTLVPESVIYGHVEDADGEPIENARIRVSRIQIQEGSKKREPASEGQTDEDGNFRIADLVHGTYYVGVEVNSSLPRNLMDLSKEHREGYPAVVYYPASPDLSSAQPVSLAPGQKVELQFSLKRESLFRISGKIAGLPAGISPNIQWLDPSGDQIFFSMQFNAQDGTFRGMVPAGAYGLRVTASGSNRQALLSEQSVNVESDLPSIHVSLAPGMSLPVIVRTEITKETAETSGLNFNFTSSGRNYQEVNVQLSATDASNRDAWASFDPEEAQNSLDLHSLKVRDVLPGKYSVHVMPIRGDRYVQSARCGSLDLLRQELVVATGGQLPPIEIVLRDDGALLTGSVRNITADSSTSLLIVPQFAPMQPARIVNMFSQGEFQSAGLAPGDYKVFAFDSDRKS